MTAILIGDVGLFNVDEVASVIWLNRLANHPTIAEHVGPHGVPHDLSDIAYRPDTVSVFYNDGDDGALFMKIPDTLQWEGHFLCTTLKGKGARAFSTLACQLLFDYSPAVAIVGDVPVEHRSARVMSRAIGCRPVGLSVDRLGRSCIRYILERP